MRDYAELVSRLRKRGVNLKEKFSRNAELLSELMQAADAIEELLAAVPKWVSVEDALPELHVNDSACVCTNTILYRTQYKTVHLGYVIETAHNIETIDGFEQIIVDRWYDQSGDMIEDVTHWMPLPSAPKEDDNGD